MLIQQMVARPKSPEEMAEMFEALQDEELAGVARRVEQEDPELFAEMRAAWLARGQR